MLRLPVLIGLLLLATGSAIGQSENKGMFVYGKTYKLNLADSSESKVGQIPLKISKNGELHEELESSKSGKYSCFLPFGDVYEIQFFDSNLVPKTLYFDLVNVGGKVAKKGFSLDLDIALFASSDSLLNSLHRVPVAKASYLKKPDMIVFNPNYSAERAQLIKRRIREIRKD